MTSRDDIKKQIEEEDKTMGSGDGTPGSSSPDLDSDDDVGEVFEKVVGHEPRGDSNIAEEMDAAEDRRRGIEPHEEEN